MGSDDKILSIINENKLESRKRDTIVSLKGSSQLRNPGTRMNKKRDIWKPSTFRVLRYKRKRDRVIIRYLIVVEFEMITSPL